MWRIFWEVINSQLIVRRVTVGVTLWLTVYVTIRGWDFAMVSRFDGLGTAACIAAVTAPLSWLMGSVFKRYEASRTDPGASK